MTQPTKDNPQPTPTRRDTAHIHDQPPAADPFNPGPPNMHTSGTRRDTAHIHAPR
jgi:hypothetical protein